MIEIKAKDGAFHAFHGTRETIVQSDPEEGPVRQVRQGVMVREMREALLDAALLRDIDDDAHGRLRPPCVVILQAAPRHDMAKATLRMQEAVVEGRDRAPVGVGAAEVLQDPRPVFRWNGSEPDVGGDRVVTGWQPVHLARFGAAIDEARPVIAAERSHAADVE